MRSCTTTRRIVLLALCGALCGALAAGCEGPMVPALPRQEPQLGSLTSAVRTTNPAVTGYWRTSLDPDPGSAELWLYRNEAELGFNAHLPDDIGYITRDSVGSTLVRHVIYWETPLASALADLERSVAMAPDGATMIVDVHSYTLCADLETPGARLATYQEYADYVRALAAAAPRTGRVRVLYWQIYNEMNYTGWTNFFGAPSDSGCPGDGADKYEQGARYAELLRLVYPAIKEATHDSGWVVMGALASDDSSTDVYSRTGRYGFVHGMYANGGRAYYDIAAIQPYGYPGVFGIRRTSDFDRVLAMYGDETRPMFMTEFGSKAPPPDQWPDLREQIESARATRLYGKIVVFVMCAGDEPYSLRLSIGAGERCNAPSTAYRELGRLQYNAALYGRDSVITTDVIVPRARGGVTAPGYDVVDEDGGAQFRVRNVPVHYREPTRVRFQGAAPPGPARPGVSYRAFVDGFGWTEWAPDSTPVGAVAFARPITALQVRVVRDAAARAVYGAYQASAWGDWAAAGGIAGDTTLGVHALRARLETTGSRVAAASLCYSAHIRGTGGTWLEPRCDGESMGGAQPASALIDGVRIWVRAR